MGILKCDDWFTKTDTMNLQYILSQNIAVHLVSQNHEESKRWHRICSPQ